MNRPMPRCRSESGFTLVEMLVALAVFALIAAAGVGLLRASVDTQAAVDSKLSGLGEVARLHALLMSDLGQAVDRPTRAPDGVRPAFQGDTGGMHFVRAGWANLDGAARSNLQRVSWRSEPRQLSRTAFRHVDGGDEGATTAAVARRIKGASFRYRDSGGGWASAFQPTERQALPSAVELTITPANGDALVMVIDLPQGSAAMAAAS